MESMAGNLQVGGSDRPAIAQLDVAVTTPPMRDSELKIIMIGRSLNWLPLRFDVVLGPRNRLAAFISIHGGFMLVSD
jgi:hypothetical protein